MKHVFFLLILCTCILLGITACNDDLPNELIEIQLNKEDKFWRPKIDEHQLVVIDNREAYNELVDISDVNINFRKYALVLIAVGIDIPYHVHIASMDVPYNQIEHPSVELGYGLGLAHLLPEQQPRNPD